MESPWDGKTKVYINGSRDMANMATIPYLVKLVKILPRTKKSNILKLGIQHKGPKFYKVFVNDDPGLILTYFTTGSILVVHALILRKLLQSNFIGITCSK